MLTIEYTHAYEEIEVGTLFAQLGIDQLAIDAEGETVSHDTFGIEIQSLDMYYPLDGFRMTKPETVMSLELESGESLIASPQHIVFERDKGWTKLETLVLGDFLVTPTGFRQVTQLTPESIELHRLYDFQVAIAHSYYTNGIFSHNSHFLVMLGANALRMGYSVLHYTFELSEEKTAIRYDSNLVDIESNDIVERKDEVKEWYGNVQGMGRLKIKYFQPNSASILTIKSHIDKLAMKGFKPDLVIIDYADLMKSTRAYDSLRFELKLIYEELRAYATEIDVPIVTASQSNKEGVDSEIIDISNMSEAYGKAMVADLILSISRRPTEKASGLGRMFIAKNRAGKDGLIFPIKMDTARSKFEIIGETVATSVVALENENDMKSALQRRWKETLKDAEIKVVKPEPQKVV